MIRNGELFVIHEPHQEGLSISAIARRTGLDRKTVRKFLKRGLLDHASYPILVHRLTVSLFASSPRSVTLTQLRFTSLAVVSSREDFHLQDRARAERTKQGAPLRPLLLLATGYG